MVKDDCDDEVAGFRGDDTISRASHTCTGMSHILIQLCVYWLMPVIVY